MGTITSTSSRSVRSTADAPRLHEFYRGKIQSMPKCPVRGLDDFAVWYTPGVAASSLAIASDPDAVYAQTNKANTVAIVSNGSRVLGLGDIGPEAGLPVMEGKAMLFKYLGGVDAIPLCIDARTPDDIVRVTEAIQPSFGGINLEDIAQPDCFEVLDRLQAITRIPVWHDDQQGTATVVSAALRNALEIVGKPIGDVSIAMIGMGAANVANYRLLLAAGIDPGRVVACDRTGTLHPGRADLEAVQDRFRDKWRICRATNERRIVGGVDTALRGADVCIAFSAPGPKTIRPAWVGAMAGDAIVFACANPTPEIWPADALAAGARVVCTGRSDFPNQVNNSLGFPGIFRGVLDVRARRISDEMALAAADVLAGFARQRGLEHGVLPSMTEWDVVPEIAAAVATTAQRQGLTDCTTSADELRDAARRMIESARESTHTLMEAGLIAPMPQDDQRGAAGR